MDNFISGVSHKYDNRLLEGRLTVEGNVIACIFSDPMYLSDYDLSTKDFITKDGVFYFSLAKYLQKAGYNTLDEVTVLSSVNSDTLEALKERGGYETIQNLVDVVNTNNANTYFDNLYRENILLHMYDDGFNLFSPIEYKSKSIIPIEAFRKMDSSSIIDWYETRLLDYDVGRISTVIDEEVIDFDDDFFESCSNGEKSGVPFETAGKDINNEDINAYPFLSRQITGLQRKTLSMIGGYSSAGKSTWLIGLIMSLIDSGERVILISNEEEIMKYKIKFTTWVLAKRNRYYNLTKKKLLSGVINDGDNVQIKSFQTFWRKNIKGKLKIVTTNDADIGTAKREIRNAALKQGFSTFIVDTFKINESDIGTTRTDLCLVKDSRELAKLAQKLDMVGFASVQLAERERGKLFLDSSVLSNSKQIKEILENLFLIRSVYSEELDSKSKNFCKPFRLKKVGDKWVEEPYEADKSAVWRMLFVEKNRNGDNSSDTGKAYLLRFDGDHSIFRETCQCRPKHGRIE